MYVVELLNGNQSKECEYIMEFPLNCFNVFILDLSRYDILDLLRYDILDLSRYEVGQIKKDSNRSNFFHFSAIFSIFNRLPHYLSGWRPGSTTGLVQIEA